MRGNAGGCALPDPRQRDDLRSLKGRLPRAGAAHLNSSFRLIPSPRCIRHRRRSAPSPWTHIWRWRVGKNKKSAPVAWRTQRAFTGERKRKDSRGRKLAFLHSCPSFFNGALCAPSGLQSSPPVNDGLPCRCNSGTLPVDSDSFNPQTAGSGVEPPPQRVFEGRALNIPHLVSSFTA